MFRLNNEGDLWIEVNSGLEETYVITLAADGVNLFAGTMHGIFFSNDLGNSWQSANDGLVNGFILSLYLSDSLLYAGSGGSGVWKRPLSEISTTNRNQYILQPVTFELYQNYPNPFNPITTIKFSLPKSEFVELKVFNILGEKVMTLVSKKLNQGNHTYTFDGKNLATGIYCYQLEAGEYREVKKMILIK